MSLLSATMLVTVNWVDTGIFLLPVGMASVGATSIPGCVIAALGAGPIGLNSMN